MTPHDPARIEDDYERCLHEWICRPESDTWFCEWCGEES